MSLMSINQRKRAASPFFAPKPPKSHLLTTPGGHISRVKDVDETPKSSVSGASFNLINSIVGAGIVGIPFAIQQCSLVLGLLMVNFFAAMTSKSNFVQKFIVSLFNSTYLRFLTENTLGLLNFK